MNRPVSASAARWVAVLLAAALIAAAAVWVWRFVDRVTDAR